MTYPTNLAIEDAFEILNIVTLKCYFSNNKLVFIISVPVTDLTPFKLYNLISLPIKFQNDTHLFVLPTSNYLAISKSYIHYITFDNIDNCKTLRYNTYLCKPFNPIYSVQNNPICEIQLIHGNSLPNSCDTRVMKTKTEIWHKLKNKS